jgi:outer membrane protein assembly factor BamB
MRSFAALSLVAGVSLAACTSPPGPSGITPRVPSFAVPSVDTNGSEWPEFRRDDQRTGYNPYQTAITKANVATLKPKWTHTTAGVFSNPVVKNGVVYQADFAGNLYAWNVTNGTKLWAFKATGQFIASPYYNANNNTLYIGARGNESTIPSKLYSINPASGAKNWEFAIANNAQISASPMVTAGLVYQGTADKNENLDECDANHQLIAVKTTAPTLVSALNLSPPGVTGADVWASPMLDSGGNLYIATGNECTTKTVAFPYANSIIRVNPTKPTMGVTWSRQSLHGPGLDQDFGATPLYADNMIVETGKDGYTYALNPSTGAIIWHRQTGAAIGSSGTDGTRVFIPTEIPQCTPGTQCGAFVALNLSNGSVAWSIPVTQTNYRFSELSAPAVSNGMVFTAFNGAIWALDATTGKKLWSYPTPNTTVFAGPAVVNGGLLVGEYTSGSTFFCFTPGGK